MGRCYVTVRKYEFTWIVLATLDEAAVNANLEKYVKAIQSKGGEVTRKEVLGRRRFAYEIDKDVLRKLIVLDEDWERRNEEAARRAERNRTSEASAPAAS